MLKIFDDTTDPLHTQPLFSSTVVIDHMFTPSFQHRKTVTDELAAARTSHFFVQRIVVSAYHHGGICLQRLGRTTKLHPKQAEAK